jgi:hypothetical protein
MSATTVRPATLRGLRALVIATIILVGVQGWFGDSIAIFVTPPDPTIRPAQTLGGLVGALQALPTPFFPVWHTFEGLALVVLGIAVLALAFAWSRSWAARIWAAIGLLSVLSAAYGGYQFLSSGFGDDASSAQMGGSFILSFASYFMVLYHTK